MNPATDSLQFNTLLIEANDQISKSNLYIMIMLRKNRNVSTSDCFYPQKQTFISIKKSKGNHQLKHIKQYSTKHHFKQV